MKKANISGIIISIIIISFIIGIFVYIPYRLNEDTRKLNERIKNHIVVSDPFIKVVGVHSSFVSGADGWYFVSALIEHKSLGEQWIYDFEYDNNANILFYNDNITGIGVIN